MEEKTTLVAVWKNGVKKIIPDLDKLNLIIAKAELKMWCEENHYKLPRYMITVSTKA